MDDATSQPSSPYHLRRRILAHLDRDRSLPDLSRVTDAPDTRVLWHLERLVAEERVIRQADGTYARGSDQSSLLHRCEAAIVPFPARMVEDFEDAFAEVNDGLYGPDAVQASGEHRTRLSTTQASEFRDRLLDLVAEYFAPGQGDRAGVKYGFHWVLTPIDLHSLDDS